jgi:hypothetical protein
LSIGVRLQIVDDGIDHHFGMNRTLRCFGRIERAEAGLLDEIESTRADFA